jgi:hypothetical protein
MKMARFSLVLDPIIRDLHSFKLKQCKINNNNNNNNMALDRAIPKEELFKKQAKE